jgi:hypothetical protein
MSIRSMSFTAALAASTLAPAASLPGQQLPAATEDRVLGTWNLNVAKSSYSPGPPPRSQQRVYRADAGGVKATVTTVNADGQPVTTEYVAGYDNVEHPLSGSPDFDGIALKRINADTAEATLTHARKIIGKARRVVSKDGKTMTITFEGTDSRGRPVRNVALYEKQEGSGPS